jgi:hypothetical protein
MKIPLADRQKEILSKLRINDAEKNSLAFANLENGQVSFADVDALCSVINVEFMMKGILPSFEPNEYGLELEKLLDLINKPRLDP